MSEPRGSTAPTWDDTHPWRINNWVGSNSWVEGARRDPDDTPRPPTDEKPYPYMLTEAAFHEGEIRRGGEIVWLHPSVIGPHHRKLPDVTYPDDEDKGRLERELNCVPKQEEHHPPIRPLGDFEHAEEQATPCLSKPAELPLL